MERLAHHESAPPPERGDDIHDSPWVTLAYLLFVFLPMAFVPDPSRALWPSALAIALFLPLHFGFYRSSVSVRP